MKKKTINEFINAACKIHNNKYDYSKVEYVNNHAKVCIICPTHGEFWQTPNNHLHGQCCPKCSHKSTKYTVEEIKEKITNKYNGKYDVSLINEYKCNTQKLPLICDEHGYFEASWNDLDNNHGCQKCGTIKCHERLRKSREEFIEESKLIHGDKYDYSLVVYKNAFHKIYLKCKKCGYIFQISPNDHLKGRGCHRCKESNLEREVRVFLNENNIKFLDKKRFNWLGNQHLDFYLPEHKIGIECQGIQHFHEIKHFGGTERFKKQFILDKNKKSLCDSHNIKLLYFSHEEYKTFLNENVIKTTNELLEKIKAQEEP